MEKKRLDVVIFEKGLTESRRVAADLINSGKILVNGLVIKKVSTKVSEDSRIELLESPKFVGRAGNKLDGALEEFKLDLIDKVVLDVGSSTGGFTDCVLQRGAKKVFAIDVGKDQLRDKLRKDERVVVMESTDIRDVKTLPEKIDLVVIDVSFISLKLVLPRVFDLITVNGEVVVLVKPQFEAGKDKVGKGGIVRDELVQKKVVEDIKQFAKTLGFVILGETKSQVVGQDGNQEYLLHFKKI